ncbi:MAG: TIGR04255 family protein [Candidatus Tectimicrobiota bacterium]|nr:MAG: TIGR04255 family protein [Candidatus Tectomicrobia bacterium]
MGRKYYRNPPIIEAVCDFRPTQDTQWDLTVPGLFYERVKDAFPHREQRVVQEFELTQGMQVLQQQIRSSERVLMFSEDRKTLIQLGPRLVVINILKPYNTWEGFKKYIEKAWSSLQEVVEVRGLERIGLRYINRIEFTTQDVNLKEYFEFYPFIGKRLPQELAFFIAGAEFPYDGGRDRCRVQLSQGIGDEGKKAIILDLDYFLARSRGVEVSAALNWVEEAHTRVEEIFEGCITDKLRAMFEEVS